VSGDCKNHLNNTCKHGHNLELLAARQADRRSGKDADKRADKRAEKRVDEPDDEEKPGKRKRPVIVISNHGMGHAPAELGLKLVQTYLGLLDADDRLPTAVCLYGEGVKLATEGSPVLEELRSLADKGVRVVVCTTCLNFFGLMDSLQAGTAGSMKDLIELQWAVKKVITL